jgi:hypothetical protein
MSKEKLPELLRQRRGVRRHRRLGLGKKGKSATDKKMRKKAKKQIKKLEKKEEGSDTKVDRRDEPPTSPFSS